MQALEVGLALGFIKIPEKKEVYVEPVTEDDGGSMELLRRNIKWLKV